MEIKRAGSQPSGKGPGEWFTSTVRIDPLHSPADPARVGIALREDRRPEGTPVIHTGYPLREMTSPGRWRGEAAVFPILKKRQVAAMEG